MHLFHSYVGLEDIESVLLEMEKTQEDSHRRGANVTPLCRRHSFKQSSFSRERTCGMVRGRGKKERWDALLQS